MDKIKKAKFSIGDEVLIISSNTRGVIEDITSYLGEGDNIYLVKVNNTSKMCIESNLRILKKNKMDFFIDVNEMAVNFQIEDKIKDIIDLLNLREANDSSQCLLNACKLQDYLATNEEYDDIKYNIGKSVTQNELFHGLVNGDFDSIINSYVFSEILKKVGMNVLNVAMKSEDGQFYVSNLVLIDENYYYFDVTLETVVYQDNKVNDDEFVLCCGALGRRSYEQFFKPLCILDFNNSLGESKLPNNIAMDDIDIDLVNKLLTLGNDISEE